MQCKQARHQIDETTQPSPELTQHLAVCGSCASFREERAVLHQGMAGLRAETATLGPSAHVEQQVLAALNAKPRQTRGSWHWITATSLAFVALVLIAVMLSVRHTHPAAPIAALPRDEPFTEMPYVIPPAPYERTTVIRTQVSPEVMQYAGLEARDDHAQTTLADVVYGQDGRILALRLVAAPNRPSGKRIN